MGAQAMNVGILGTGDVEKALGKGFVTLGHDVRMGSREAQNEKALAWAKEMGEKASVGTFADARPTCLSRATVTTPRRRVSDILKDFGLGHRGCRWHRVLAVP
jgi:predicted dinucleotide-binding enzyme